MRRLLWFALLTAVFSGTFYTAWHALPMPPEKSWNLGRPLVFLQLAPDGRTVMLAEEGAELVRDIWWLVKPPFHTVDALTGDWKDTLEEGDDLRNLTGERFGVVQHKVGGREQTSLVFRYTSLRVKRVEQNTGFYREERQFHGPKLATYDGCPEDELSASLPDMSSLQLKTVLGGSELAFRWPDGTMAWTRIIPDPLPDVSYSPTAAPDLIDSGVEYYHLPRLPDLLKHAVDRVPPLKRWWRPVRHARYCGTDGVLSPPLVNRKCHKLPDQPYVVALPIAENDESRFPAHLKLYRTTRLELYRFPIRQTPLRPALVAASAVAFLLLIRWSWARRPWRRRRTAP